MSLTKGDCILPRIEEETVSVVFGAEEPVLMANFVVLSMYRMWIADMVKGVLENHPANSLTHRTIF